MLLQWHNSSLSPRLVTNLCAFYRPLRLTHWHPPCWRHTRDNTAEEAEVTSKEVDWRLELQTNFRKVRAALKHYTNQPARPLWPSSCYHYPPGKSPSSRVGAFPAIIQLQASRRFVWSSSGGGVVSIFSTINHWSDTGPVFTPSPGQPQQPAPAPAPATTATSQHEDCEQSNEKYNYRKPLWPLAVHSRAQYEYECFYTRLLKCSP